MDGVAEEAAEFRRPVVLADVSRFRRIAGIGPVYEVTAIHGAEVIARVVDDDQTFTYPLVEAERDPLA